MSTDDPIILNPPVKPRKVSQPVEEPAEVPDTGGEKAE